EEDRHYRHHEERTPPLLALFDKHHAEVGGTLSVLVYVPSRGSRLLLTVEGRTVVDYLITTTPADGGRYVVVEVPVKERYLPDVFVKGRVVVSRFAPREERLRFKEQEELEKARDLDEGENPRWCRVDVIDPKGRPGGEKLKVEVSADREVYKPGDEVKVRLRVTDREGKPRQAETSLTAVDESVYSFGGDRVGSLAGLFDDPHPERLYVRKTWRAALPLA